MNISINNNTKKIEFKYLNIMKTKEMLEHIAKYENTSEYEENCINCTLDLLNDLTKDYYGA